LLFTAQAYIVVYSANVDVVISRTWSTTTLQVTHNDAFFFCSMWSRNCQELM